jgi:hypothetical protein
MKTEAKAHRAENVLGMGPPMKQTRELRALSPKKARKPPLPEAILPN